MYSPSPTTVMKRPFGLCKRAVANISVVPISLMEREFWFPSMVVSKYNVVAGVDEFARGVHAICQSVSSKLGRVN